MSPGEWDSAGSVKFAANKPVLEGGGTTPATLYVMNDAVNLYLAVRVQRPSLDTSSVGFEFDNNHNGVREPGDDAFVLNSQVGFFDDFRGPCPGDSPDSVRCGLDDTSDGGTNDGLGAAANDGTFSVYELSHPLNSGDNRHDFNLKGGDTVGFTLLLRLIVGPFPDGFGDTGFPTSCILCANLFGDIVISLQVQIDIKPGTLSNPVNLKSRGTIPVAILSTPTFDAPSRVDRSALTFGRTGDEASLAFCNKGGEDVNGDGLLDLVCHFNTQSAGFQVGDLEGVLKGRALDGATIEGRDSVLILK